MDKLLTMLHNISLKLDGKELDSLKFLCQNYIEKKKRESISSTNELFLCLIEQMQITEENLGYLKTLLKDIKREDLVQVIQEFESNRLEVDAEPQLLERDQLGQAFEVICDNVGMNWKMLIRTLGVREVIMEHAMVANPYNMYEQKMYCLKEWKKNKGKDAQVSNLLQALKKCRMVLVAEKIMEELQINGDSF
ncbi:LOW QUALITY PROTEIN: FAS-associated death domain protein [Bombina bombina]|uniref:LOW QUALITY PROTEIN: FAS-associated death domain protein n=1 Tax=Bombina bombina TaxID=8345 RepID=UPI00235A5C19|nr:LOW QUALITY PROTEIN: FAS-associated death domain protein [Bombina bombina]